MDPLSITASIIAIIQLTGSVVSSVYTYRKDVKNAPEDAAKVIQDLTGLSQILERLLRMIEGGKATSLEGLIQPGGPLEVCQTTLERLNAKLQPGNGWRATKQSLKWPLNKDSIKKSLDEIASAKTSIGLALQIDQISRDQEIKEGVDTLTSSFESFRLDEKRKELFSSISPTDATGNHLEACRKHHAGTSDWFIDSEQYSRWVGAADSVLWINGIPGCGKTILCSTAIENLLHHQQPKKQRAAVAYYYFNFQNQAEQQFVNMLRSIILQLVCQYPDQPSFLRKLEWYPQSNFSDEYLTSIVKDILERFLDVYIVIDALDECEQGEEVLRWIRRLFQSRNNKIHMLVSSRQDHRLQNAFQPATLSTLALDEHSFKKDIQQYIRNRLHTDIRMMRWPSNVQNDIEQSLMANSGGLFRWIDCQFDVLRKCLRVNNIKSVLDTPPKTLNETYDRILTSIHDAYVEDTCKILQWLVFSPRPMQINELNEVLAFERNDQDVFVFSLHLRLPFLEDVLTVCSSLVAVSEKTATVPADSSVKSLEVRLAHNSVKDYLVSHHIKKGPSVKFALEAALANSSMAECCLVYLLQLQTKLDTSMLLEYPLGPYAAQFWTEHYRHRRYSDEDLLERLALQLLTAESSYRNCCSLFNPDRRWQGIELERDPELPALYYASLTGLSRMIMPLVLKGADPNVSGRRCHLGGALGAAAFKGDKDSVQALLRAGANPSGGEWDSYYSSPIASAASQGHKSIVALLLQAGADVDKTDYDGKGSALYQAVDNSHLETAKVLMDAGADVCACEGMSGVTYAISIAAQRCDQELLHLLFSKAPDWAAEMVMDEIADAGQRELFESLLKIRKGRKIGLTYAARSGWSDLVQQIVDESSRNATDEHSTGAALHNAAAAGSLETIQILYENMQEKALSVDEISEAVASAAVNGYSLVVKYLLDRGADICSQMCQNALVQAAEWGHLSTVQVLLSAGVSHDSHYEEQRLSESGSESESKSCLWVAVDRQHVDIVRLLLAYGASPNTQYHGVSALNRSIEMSNEGLFGLLLEKGASTEIIQIEGAQYDTLSLPVHYAASVGNIHILCTLLDAGLEADGVLITDGWTALFHAAKAGHEEVLRRLIGNYGADFKRHANKGTLPIHTAAYHNHDKCVEVFLDAGLDIDVRGRGGRTSLHWAVQEGSIDAVRILLERGADIFIEDEGTFMKPVDIAKAKLLEISESQKPSHHWREPLEEDYELSESSISYHWRKPREENYEPILKMLVDQETQSQHKATKT